MSHYLNRPSSISTLSKDASGATENGTGVSELNEATKFKAEAKYLNFYQLHADPDPAAQGTAPFN
jgi:pre-mRNA-processing factor 39